MAESHEFRRRVLLLVTTGGFTHAGTSPDPPVAAEATLT